MSTIDPMDYRTTLGTYPTGVVVITGATPDGPVGVVIGSFTSVSLDPPLVGFLPGKSSTSWPKISATGRFCVNILADDQMHVVNAWGREGKKFDETPHHPAPGTGSPIIDGVISWIDCTLDTEADAGDHWWVMGAIEAMAVERDDAGALQFFRGKYGAFNQFPPPA
jgi:3-hydroxy-9,10-secoandrosta-1,3,5(10)-triene-9,17-dione monooxygenase reductase component